MIESILLRIPLPAFYFSSDKDGKYQVVDGLQGLATIHDFVRRDGFALQDLEYFDDLSGKRFKDLRASPVWQRRINTTQLFVNLIDQQTPIDVKFDVFKRINSGGTPLTDQEIRHCLSTSRARGLLKELAKSSEFVEATSRALLGSIRMVDREVVLRFIAFLKFPGQDNFRECGSMAEFLNRANKWLDCATDTEPLPLLLRLRRLQKRAPLQREACNRLASSGVVTSESWQVLGPQRRTTPGERPRGTCASGQSRRTPSESLEQNGAHDPPFAANASPLARQASSRTV